MRVWAARARANEFACIVIAQVASSKKGETTSRSRKLIVTSMLIFDRKIRSVFASPTVKAEVVVLNGLSSHADQRAQRSSSVSFVAGPWSSKGYRYIAVVFPKPFKA